jgi:Sigma-70 region 3
MAVGVVPTSPVPGFLGGGCARRRADSRDALFADARPDSRIAGVVRVWLAATIAELTRHLARPPTVEELAAALGVQHDAALEAMDRRHAHRSQSVDASEHRQHLLTRLRELPARERRTAVRFVYEADVRCSVSPPTGR